MLSMILTLSVLFHEPDLVEHRQSGRRQFTQRRHPPGSALALLPLGWRNVFVTSSCRHDPRFEQRADAHLFRAARIPDRFREQPLDDLAFRSTLRSVGRARAPASLVVGSSIVMTVAEGPTLFGVVLRSYLIVAAGLVLVRIAQLAIVGA
jgi:hypothetical protein